MLRPRNKLLATLVPEQAPVSVLVPVQYSRAFTHDDMLRLRIDFSTTKIGLSGNFLMLQSKRKRTSKKFFLPAVCPFKLIRICRPSSAIASAHFLSVVCRDKFLKFSTSFWIFLKRKEAKSGQAAHCTVDSESAS